MTLTALRAEHFPTLLPIWNRPEVLSVLAPSMAKLTDGGLADLLTRSRPGTLTQVYSILEKDEIVGTVSLTNMNPITRCGEITNRVVASKCGWMVGMKACRDVLRIGFMDFNLNRLECYVHDGNRATHIICQRMGGVKEGVMKQAAFKGGKYVDVTIYSMLRGDWNGTI